MKKLLFFLELFLLFLALTGGFLKERKAAMEQGAQAVKEMLALEHPKVALTFDDGPHRTYTRELLDGLKEREVRASFFLIGQNIEGNEELVRRMAQEGHLIGNHTFHHKNLSRLSEGQAKEEILDACQAIYQASGQYPAFIRPPFGEWKKGLEFEIEMFPASWSVDSKDWETKNPEKIVKRVVKDTGEGDIILMHDIYDSSVKAALRIVDILREQGFEFVTVDELVLE